MKQTTTTTVSIIYTLLRLLLLVLPMISSIKTCLCDIDEQYLACEPKSCGNGQNISYPFWIKGRQEDYCGYPGFDLVCNTENQPVLTLFRFNYTVQNIYYNNQSLRITNDALFPNDSSSSSCSLPIQNLTLYGDRFKFADNINYTNMFFFSNCSSVLKNLTPYEVDGCSENDGINGTTSLAILEQDLKLVNVSSAAENNCTSTVKVPVQLYGDEGKNGMIIDKEKDWWEYYEMVLRRGFVLNYRASDCGKCETSGGRCGFNEEKYQFRCFCTDRPHLSDCNSSTHLRLKLGLGIGGAMIFIIVAVSLVLYCRYKRKYAPEMLSRNSSSDPNSKSYLDRGSVYFGVPIFSYSELEEATNNFDSNKELGDGGFGTVYHGILRDGREVAVKRLYESNYKRVEQFMNEVEILTRLHHKNLVTLYGCTSRHSRELLLVYEYIPNGTVADHLHGDRATPGAVTWPIRLSIAIETANALAYLHASDIIHRDVKTNNILLDNNFCVKVADFGLSRLFPLDVTHISTAPQGTPGYVDPEYHQCYQLTEKSDVYSFGVVLIELISSLPAVDISRHRHEINLSNLAINKIQTRAYNELIDPFLGFESDPSIERMTTAVAELAFQCLQNDKEMRPSMVEVLETLKGIESGARSHEAELIEEVGDIVGVLNSVKPPPSPESDEAVLLNKMRPPFSPISVTEKWIISTATTPSTSA